MATTAGSGVSLVKAIRSGLAGVAQRRWGREPHDASVLPPMGKERISSFARMLSDQKLLDWTQILGWYRPDSVDRLQFLSYIASNMFGLTIASDFYSDAIGPCSIDITASFDSLDVKGSHPIAEEAWSELPEFLAFVAGYDTNSLGSIATLHFFNHNDCISGDKLVKVAERYAFRVDVKSLYEDLLKRGFLKESAQC